MQTKKASSLSARLLSLLLVLITIFTILPTTAFASDFDPVDATQAAGGSGSMPGNPKPGGNSGIWSERFQGFRITVVDYLGEPAFTFMGKNYMDLLFSTDKVDQMDYFGDGHKIGYYRSTVDSKAKLNAAILTITGIRGMLDNGSLKTAVPNADELGKAIKKMSTGAIPFPLELKGSTWVRNGTQVKNVFYGAGGKLDSTALLYTIMNLHTVNDKGIFTNMWQPKSGANLGDTPITAEELGWLKSGLGPDGKAYTPIQLMSDKGLVISVEPIIWNNLRESKTKYSYGVYGTQTSIGGICKWLEGGGWFKPVDSWAKGYGGYDKALFGNSGRRSLVVDSTSIIFSGYMDAAGNKISQNWSIEPPKDTSQITDSMVYQRQPGWALHLYLLGKQKPAVPQTHTWDIPTPDPQPAPDPAKIPKLPDEDIAKTRVYNIVKTYREKTTDDSGNEVVNHISTFSRTKNPAIITIEDEPSYKVKEWFISETYNNPSKETTWEDNHSQAPTTGPTGTKPSTTEIKPKNTTLYVLLEKEEAKLKEGSLIIQESQVTKSVETMTSPVTGWGPKTMTFSADDISGPCGYSWYCGGDYCSGHTCGATYGLYDRSWNYNHINIAGINETIHANVGAFKPTNDRGADATGTRGTVSQYINFVNSFNYKLVVWRGEDVPTIANYKEQSSNTLNTLVKRYGKEPAGQRYGSYSGKSTQYNTDLKIDLAQNMALGDYITDAGHHDESASATHIALNTLNYDTVATVKVYKQGDNSTDNN